MLLCCHFSAFHCTTALLPHPTSHSAHPHPISNVSHPIAQIQLPNMHTYIPRGRSHIQHLLSHTHIHYPTLSSQCLNYPISQLPHALITQLPSALLPIALLQHTPYLKYPIWLFQTPNTAHQISPYPSVPFPWGMLCPTLRDSLQPPALPPSPRTWGWNSPAPPPFPQTGHRSALWDEPMPSRPAVLGKDTDLPLLPHSPPCCCP